MEETRNIFYWSRLFFGGLLLLVGLLGIGFGILALIDPIGSKMSDDADPFGVPDSLEVSLLKTGFYVLVFLLGFMLLRLKSKPTALK